jgi:hypothetical protein
VYTRPLISKVRALLASVQSPGIMTRNVKVPMIDEARSFSLVCGQAKKSPDCSRDTNPITNLILIYRQGNSWRSESNVATASTSS